MFKANTFDFHGLSQIAGEETMIEEIVLFIFSIEKKVRSLKKQ